MPCPTCEHTMQSILEPKGIVHWCPRCGTIKLAGGVLVEAPKLVERCREFEKRWQGQWMPQQPEWVSDGIAEAINVPKDRPQ